MADKSRQQMDDEEYNRKLELAWNGTSQAPAAGLRNDGPTPVVLPPDAPGPAAGRGDPTQDAFRQMAMGDPRAHALQLVSDNDTAARNYLGMGRQGTFEQGANRADAQATAAQNAMAQAMKSYGSYAKGGGYREGDTTYQSPMAAQQSQMQQFMGSWNAANPQTVGLSEGFGDLQNPAQRQQQAMQAYQAAMGGASDARQQQLREYLGVGQLGQGQQAQNLARQQAMTQADQAQEGIGLARQRLGLDTQKFGLEGQRFGFDQTQADRQNQLAQGSLEVQRRAQQLGETKNAFDQSKAVDEQKLYQQLITVGGQTPQQAKASIQSYRQMKQGSPTDAYAPMPFGMGPGQQQGATPAVPAGNQIAGQGGAAQPGAGDINKTRPDPALADPDQKYADAFGPDVLGEASATKQGDAYGTLKLLNDRVLSQTPTHLRDGTPDPAFDSKLATVQDYIKNRRGMAHEYDQFLNPSTLTTWGNRVSNAVTPPSQQEILRSQIRQRMGMGAAPLGEPPGFSMKGIDAMKNRKPGAGATMTTTPPADSTEFNLLKYLGITK